MAGIFDTDAIITGGTGGASSPPANTTPDLCVDPGAGMPRYVKIVLDDLLGEGTISRADYRAVVAGTKSIENLQITPAQLARLRCDAVGDGTAASDPHFDPTRPPTIASIGGALASVVWTGGHKPTDKTHRLTATTPSGVSAQAGAQIAHITFGTPYQDEDGQLVAPNVLVTGVGGSTTWRASNITPQGYDLYSDSGIASATVASCQVVIEPARL
jgi:hypothetical protein